MFGKHSKLFFLVSMVVLVVAIVLAAWGFQKIVDKQIQRVSLFLFIYSVFDVERCVYHGKHVFFTIVQ